MASTSKKAKIGNYMDYHELRLENHSLRRRMEQLEKNVHGLQKAVKRKAGFDFDSNSSDDANSPESQFRKKILKKKYSSNNESKLLQCPKCKGKYKTLMLLAQHMPKCSRRLSKLLQSSSSGYEMSSTSDLDSSMDIGLDSEIIDLTNDDSMSVYETASSSSGCSSRRSSMLSNHDSSESHYFSAISDVSAVQHIPENGTISAESTEISTGDSQSDHSQRINESTVDQSSNSSFAQVPILRDAQHYRPDDSQLINGVVYDRNLTFNNGNSMCEKTMRPIFDSVRNIAVDHSMVEKPLDCSNLSPIPFQNDSIETVHENSTNADISLDKNTSNSFATLPNQSHSPFSSDQSNANSESHSENSISELETTFHPIYSTLYMLLEVRRIAEQNAREYSIEDIIGDTMCKCCLCSIRQKNNLEFELNDQYCIFHDPLNRTCDRIQNKRKSNTRKSNADINETCENCLDMIVMCAKKNQKTKELKCGMNPCTFKTTNRNVMKNHYKKHLNIKNFRCGLCDRGFLTKSTMRKHERTHLNQIRSPFRNITNQ